MALLLLLDLASDRVTTFPSVSGTNYRTVRWASDGRTLLAHGTRDPRVPYAASEQFVAALAERQKPVTFMRFDHAGHGFTRPADRARIYTAVADFFTAHLA